MERNPWQWTRDDLDNLMAQPESLQLEFKQSRLFESEQSKIVDNLSAEVSAFANTVGGVIVVGISERKDGKIRVANNIDEGVNVIFWGPEKVQQIIVSNLSPFLPGIRVTPIYLNEEKSRCAYVICIPEGTTAYQASDKKYYGRVEFESKPLPDHEIRFRMFKGKSASAIISVVEPQIRSISRSNPSNNLVQDEFLKTNSTWVKVHKYSFSIGLLNNGEIDIMSFKLNFDVIPKSILIWNYKRLSWRYHDGEILKFGNRYFDQEYPHRPFSLKLYPQDLFIVDDIEFEVPASCSLQKIDAEITWSLYLSNQTPLHGKINLFEEFKHTEIMPG